MFEVGKELLLARNSEDVLRYLRNLTDAHRFAIGDAARRRVLAEHTPRKRALQLESYLEELNDNVFAHTPWSHRRNRKGAGRVETGLASELVGKGAGPKPRAEVVGTADRRGVHEPAGAGD